MASATVYGRRRKFFRAEHLATAEGENWAYSPTLVRPNDLKFLKLKMQEKQTLELKSLDPWMEVHTSY